MDEFALENESVYWPGNFVSLSAVELNKIAVTLNRIEHFELTYSRKPLRPEIKAACGFINRGLCRGNSITLQVYPPSGLIWNIFNAMKNEIHKTDNRLNTFVVLNKIQICPSERLKLILLHYFEDMIIDFEPVAEINNGVFCIHVLVNN